MFFISNRGECVDTVGDCYKVKGKGKAKHKMLEEFGTNQGV